MTKIGIDRRLKRPRRWSSILMTTCVAFFLCFSSLCSAFNVDVLHPIIFEDPGIGGGWNGRDSYFGFSVALHNFTDSVSDLTTWVLVGAPRGNRSSSLYPPATGNDRVVEPGVLYKCSLWSDKDSCVEVVLDQTVGPNEPFIIVSEEGTPPPHALVIHFRFRRRCL
ncbi:unnamed protein product, partial [Notodromas monacha]